MTFHIYFSYCYTIHEVTKDWKPFPTSLLLFFTELNSNGQMENIPILQDFVPYQSRYPKSKKQVEFMGIELSFRIFTSICNYRPGDTLFYFSVYYLGKDSTYP